MCEFKSSIANMQKIISYLRYKFQSIDAEHMAKFRYLGTGLTDQNLIHAEIRSR
jgi:hypothetical protein